MQRQCLGSGSAGSARYWLHVSGSNGVKYQPKTAKKIILLQQPKSEFLKKENIKISSFLNGSSSFRSKIDFKEG